MERQVLNSNLTLVVLDRTYLRGGNTCTFKVPCFDDTPCLQDLSVRVPHSADIACSSLQCPHKV